MTTNEKELIQIIHNSGDPFSTITIALDLLLLFTTKQKEQGETPTQN
jgi:hypothetical protein